MTFEFVDFKQHDFKSAMETARWHHEWSLNLKGNSAIHHQRMSDRLYREARELRENALLSNPKQV